MRRNTLWPACRDISLRHLSQLQSVRNLILYPAPKSGPYPCRSLIRKFPINGSAKTGARMTHGQTREFHATNRRAPIPISAVFHKQAGQDRQSRTTHRPRDEVSRPVAHKHHLRIFASGNHDNRRSHSVFLRIILAPGSRVHYLQVLHATDFCDSSRRPTVMWTLSWVPTQLVLHNIAPMHRSTRE